MKIQILLFFILFKITIYSQTPKAFEKEINNLIEKRNNARDSDAENSSDLLSEYNKQLEKLVLKFTSSNPETLTYEFKNLANGLNIISSADGQFRIYNWNTLEGGSMQYYTNVFQYKSNGKVYSKLSGSESDKKNRNVKFYEINEVNAGNKQYYITNSVFIGSSALYYYEAKIFSIENGKLNENATLIKTKSGIKNTLGYEIDLSSSVNKNRNDGVNGSDYMKLIYDKKENTIIIPLINENGKITKSKIKYKFKDKYFERL